MHIAALMNTCRVWSCKIVDSPITTSSSPTSGRVSRMWNCTATWLIRPGSDRCSCEYRKLVEKYCCDFSPRVAVSKFMSLTRKK